MKRFIGTVFSLYLLFAVFVSLIHILFEYRNIRDQIHVDLESIYISSSGPLAAAMWSWDPQQVESLVDGLLTLQFISGIKVDEGYDGLNVVKGKVEAKNTLTFKGPIIFAEGLEYHKLGTVELVSDRSVIFDRIRVNITFIIANAFFKTFFLSIIIFFIGRKLIGIPLEKLSSSVGKLNFDNLKENKVDIDKDSSKNRNELTELIEAYNKMLDKLISRTIQRDQARKELEDKNINLEKIVDEKTIELREKVNELSSLNQKLDVAASTDFLTGALNRRSFFERSEAELKRLQRENKNACIVMIDIDFFKAVNDNYGHAAGDAVLIFVLQKLQQGVRQHDIVARLGGEEFVILLSDIEQSQAVDLSERLRKTLEAGSILFEEESIAVTASFGLYMIENEDVHDSISKADALLYDAKSSGRNTVKY
ncbi:MAG: diguanylate cyclase [Cellvibrionaceae bacterium]